MRYVLGLCTAILITLTLAGVSMAYWTADISIYGSIELGTIRGTFVAVSAEQISPGHGNYRFTAEIDEHENAVVVTVWRGTGKDPKQDETPQEAQPQTHGANPYTLDVRFSIHSEGTVPLRVTDLPVAIVDPGYNAGAEVFGEDTVIGPGETVHCFGALLTVGKHLDKYDPVIFTISLKTRQWVD